MQQNPQKYIREYHLVGHVSSHELNYAFILFFLCADKLFTSTLTGAAGILAIFLVLLLFLFYKYKQVRCTHNFKA